MERPLAWGYHYLIDARSGNQNICSIQKVSEFVSDLVRGIDMVAYGDLMIERFATHDPDKAGISFCQMIETSNITGHFVDLNGDFYVDIFSCKPYNTDIVDHLIEEYFTPKMTYRRMEYRGLK